MPATTATFGIAQKPSFVPVTPVAAGVRTTGDVQDGEIAITGSRVREENGSRTVVVPWVETIYYGKQQNGYHGGATPQEMVSPLVILMDKTSTYSGLFPCEYPKPEWWSAPPVASLMVEEPRTPVAVVVSKMAQRLSSTTSSRRMRSRPLLPSRSVPQASNGFCRVARPSVRLGGLQRSERTCSPPCS